MYKYIGILLGAHPILHISRIKVKYHTHMHVSSYYLIIKVNFTPEQDIKVQRGRRGIALLFLETWHYRWGGWPTPCSHYFTYGRETQNPLYKRLGGPQGQSESQSHWDSIHGLFSL
jgi:hypothetical protein